MKSYSYWSSARGSRWWVRLVIAGLGAWMLAGCAAGPPPDSYEVTIRTGDFSTAETEAVLGAVDDWESHAPVKLHATLGDCSPQDNESGKICIVAATPPPGDLGWTTNGRGYGAGILIGKDARANLTLLQQTATHELGHAMGLAHIAPGNIMGPSRAQAALSVQRGDIDEWYFVRARYRP